ncbi:hypothetical protein BDW62DRAFT_203948 [Aspergillus aurantiobrunneus]
MTDKVCVVTGASRGIGQAITESLAEAGAHIINIHQSPDPTLPDKAARLDNRCGVTVVNRQCNVAYPAAVEAALCEGFGKVDVFVAPGYIDTALSSCQASNNEVCRMAALGRLGHVKELKAMNLYPASDASSFVTGAEFTVDGGYTLP